MFIKAWNDGSDSDTVREYVAKDVRWTMVPVTAILCVHPNWARREPLTGWTEIHTAGLWYTIPRPISEVLDEIESKLRALMGSRELS